MKGEIEMRMRVRLYEHQLFMLPATYSSEEAEDLIRSLPVVDTCVNADVVDWKDVKGHMFAIVVFDDGSVSTRRLTEIREETRDSRERAKKSVEKDLPSTEIEKEKYLRINPGCCFNCPVYDIEDCSCDPGPDFIEFDDIIDPNCPLRTCSGITIYLRDDQKKA